MAAIETAGPTGDVDMSGEDSFLDSYWEDRLSGGDYCDDRYDCEDFSDCEECYDDCEDDYDDSMDGDFDSAMRDAGHGTDEDYGYYGEYDDAA